MVYVNYMKPNFFIVGGSKSGTTNISYYLNQHPQVFVSELNEPYYFCRFDVPEDFERPSMIKDEVKYLKLFKNVKNHKAIGEATSAYLHCPHAASEIKKSFPDSKIIISLRNPIEKAHSSYFSYKFMHPDNRSFIDMINCQEQERHEKEFFIYNFIEAGFFSKHIKRYQDEFRSDNIKIIIFENYIKNESEHIKSILKFLGIDESINSTEQPKGSYRVPKNKITASLLGSSRFRKMATKLIPTVQRQKLGDKFFLKQTKKPPMLSSERKRLKEIYEAEVRNLEELLGYKLPWDDFCSTS